MEDTREDDPLNQLTVHIGSERLKKQAQGLQWSAPGPLHINYGCKLGVFVGFPIVGVHVSLTLCLFMGIFLLIGFLVQPKYKASCLVLLYLILLHLVVVS